MRKYWKPTKDTGIDLSTFPYHPHKRCFEVSLFFPRPPEGHCLKWQFTLILWSWECCLSFYHFFDMELETP